MQNTNKKTEKIGEFTYYNSRTNENVYIKEGLKHILVFGQSRQGKSSIINMMTGRDVTNGAIVSQNVIGSTFSTEPWINNEYCFWDTAGLNEQDDGLVRNKSSIKNLISFIKIQKVFMRQLW